MRAIIVHRHGGPEELVLGERPAPVPGSGEVLIDIAAAGVNFHDVDVRGGLFPPERLPYVPGIETAGTVAAVGEGVTGFQVGDLVAALVFTATGAYTEQALAGADQVVKVPEGVTARQACAVLLQGMTAHYLSRDVVDLEPGRTTVLVHAAAGGLGQLLTQVLTRRGVRVIGTVSTPEKEKVALAAGATDVIRYTETDFAEAARRLTSGRGVDVVFDGVGQATFAGSLAAIRTRGTVVLYGQTSGVVPPLDMRAGKPGSPTLVFPLIPDFISGPGELRERATAVLEWVRSGEVTVTIGKTYPLEDAAIAHEDLELRRSSGKLLLIP